MKKVICFEKIKQIVAPYSRIKCSYIGRVLACSDKLVEKYLQEMILDGKLDGAIDDMDGYFENNQQQKAPIDKEKENSLNSFASAIQAL